MIDKKNLIVKGSAFFLQTTFNHHKIHKECIVKPQQHKIVSQANKHENEKI